MQPAKENKVVYFFRAIGDGTHSKHSVTELDVSIGLLDMSGEGRCQCGGENKEDRAQSQVLFLRCRSWGLRLRPNFRNSPASASQVIVNTSLCHPACSKSFYT